MTPSREEEAWLGPQEIHLRDYWQLLIRRRRVVIFSFLVVVVTALASNLAMRPIYRAATTLQIEPESPKIFSFENMFQVDATTDAFYQTQYRLIESRSLAGRVIDREGLLESPELVGTEEAGAVSRLRGWIGSLPSLAIGGIRRLLGTSPPSIVTPAEGEGPSVIEAQDPRYTNAIDAFLARLKVEPIRNTRLARVYWDSTDPVTAAKITNATARTYIDMNLEAKYETTEQTSQFLAGEIERLQREIADAEAELQRYGSERDIISLDERQDTVTQALADLSAEHTRAQTDRVQKQTDYEQLRGSDPSSILGVFTNSLIQRLKSDYADMQQRYSEMSRRFTEDWPEMQRLRAQMTELEDRIATEEKKIAADLVNSARNSYQAALDQESRIAELLEEKRNETMQLNRNLVAYRNLRIEIDNKKNLLDSLFERQSETGVSARLQGMRTSNIRVVDPATVPLSPYKPNIRQNLLLSAVLGLILAAGLAFFLEYMDNTLKSAEDVERHLGLPSLGLVPTLSSLTAGGKRGKYLYPYVRGYGMENYTQHMDPGATVELVSAEHPQSALAETFRSLRTAVLLSNPGQPPKVLLVTSSVPGEGKTSTALNLAASLAQTGKKVLLIDADMRRPRLHRLLELEQERGLVHYLTGSAPQLKEIVLRTKVENLWVIQSGPRPPNPAELLGSKLAEAMFKAVREAFDAVVVDSAPVMAVVDPLVLAPRTDGVVLVAKGGETPYPAVERTRRRLEKVHARVLGILLNNMEIDPGWYPGYYRGRSRSDSHAVGETHAEEESTELLPQQSKRHRRAQTRA